MESRIPERHPLRQLFGALAERAFTEELGWPDFKVSDYVSKLLVDFTHTDHLYRIKNAQGERAEAVVELLYESEVLQEAASVEREREVHQHIGDFTLFMAGLFPEYLKRIKTGKRSYRIAAEFDMWPSATADRPSSPLFHKLSENFELCVVGLGFIRGDLDRMQDERYHQARRILLN